MQVPELAATQPAAGDLVGPAPPAARFRTSQLHRWTSLSFLHWPFAPEVVQPLLPPGLQVDSFAGAAWVGLIPFRLDIRAPGIPYLPWAGHFVETNVRTYVRAEDGTRGIWFLSLDAARLAAVTAARATWSLPYQWSRMRLTQRGNLITYECRRRWPGVDHPTSRVVLELGSAYSPEELDDLDNFLTARWILFSPRGASLVRTQAHHDAWPLRRASIVELDDHLLRAAGLPPTHDPPRVLYSDGVAVRLGRLRTD